jgi:hypothetical protein
MELSPAKVAHIIVRAREYDAKVAAWDDDPAGDDAAEDSEAILEDLKDDATRSELAQFIAGLNDDEQVELVALAWVGRGTYSADEWDEAVDTARSERVNRTEDYLLGIPLLSDYLEEGLEAMGLSIEDAEDDVL